LIQRQQNFSDLKTATTLDEIHQTTLALKAQKCNTLDLFKSMFAAE
jgi:hypothetical protein